MRILCVDDDAMITSSLKVILSSVAGFGVVGTARDGQEALAFVKAHPVDIVLMDIRMPVMDGITACARIKEIKPDIQVIMLTTFRDFKHIHQALHAGASGYLLKSDQVETQIATIKQVFEGQAIISLEALNTLTKSQAHRVLSERENSCLELVAHGYTNKEIAKRLFIGEGTVRNTISTVLDKLELRDRTQLAIYYWQTQRSERDPLKE